MPGKLPVVRRHIRSGLRVAGLMMLFPMMGFPVQGAEGVIVEEGITYGVAGQYDLKLDLARPAEGDGPFPALVFIHGGGWRGGTRLLYRGEIEYHAARRGYVAVSISYRLTEPDAQNKARHPFPTQIHDVKCAVRWLRANAAKYKIDSEQIGAVGFSAGGHLALLAGLADSTAKLEGDCGHSEQSSRVQAVVNLFGPTDFLSFYEKSDEQSPLRLLLESLLGGTPASAPDQYKAASPVTWIDKDDPPVLTLHGDKDGIVPVDQARILDQRMKEAGASHVLIVMEGQGHGFFGEPGKLATAKTYEFLDKYLKPPKKP